jgi:hypothetical protein
MMMGKLVEWTVLTGETEVLGKNLPRRHFVHHKSHLPDLGANPGRRGRKPATNRFSYYSQKHISFTTSNLGVRALYVFRNKETCFKFTTVIKPPSYRMVPCLQESCTPWGSAPIILLVLLSWRKTCGTIYRRPLERVWYWTPNIFYNCIKWGEKQTSVYNVKYTTDPSALSHCHHENFEKITLAIKGATSQHCTNRTQTRAFTCKDRLDCHKKMPG